MATVPFLMAVSARTGWFSMADLTNMIAISESTPGPIGVNMATYVGYHVAGVSGAVVSTVSLTLPAFFIVLILAKIFSRLREKPRFSAVFSAMRPASVGLITAVLLRLCFGSFFTPLEAGGFVFQPLALLLFGLVTGALFVPKVKNLPLPVFLLFSALFGIAFHMGG